MEVYMHGVEIMGETFVQSRGLGVSLKVSIPCFGNIERNYY